MLPPLEVGPSDGTQARTVGLESVERLPQNGSPTSEVRTVVATTRELRFRRQSSTGHDVGTYRGSKTV